MSLDFELVIKVALAAVVGGVIGLEREVGGHDPGIRTHALVAVGAALFTVAGAYGFADVETDGTADPARVAAQVASGVGFIGAGAVLRSGATVRGLTTAATLWVSAAIGVAAGAGIFVPLMTAAIVTLIVLIALKMAKSHLLMRFGGVHRVLRIEYERGHGTIGPVIRELGVLPCRIGELHVEDDDEGCASAHGRRRVTIFVQTRDEQKLAATVHSLAERTEVTTVSLEPLSG